MAATVLDIWDMSMNQTDKDLWPPGAYIPAGKTETINRNKVHSVLESKTCQE